MGIRSFLNIERQFSFYGAYHTHPVNVAIHITCVPLIMLTAFEFTSLSFAKLPFLEHLPPDALQFKYLPLDTCTIAAVLYSILYAIMEPVAGSVLGVIVMSFAVIAHYLIDYLGSAVATKICLGVHVTAWLAQFVGHGVFEGRAPALLDNLVQALFLAPIFVWLEVLFMCGYRPDLKQRVDRVIASELSGLRKGKLRAAKERREKQNRENSKRE